MPSNSVTISRNGKIVSGNGGLSIEYRGVDNCPYGKSATADKEDLSGIVIHHTAPDHDADWYIQYQIDGDPVRGGHFGYHFYIAQDGKIVQGAPLTKRTNHVKPSSASQRRTFRRELNNKNALGISCVGAGKRRFSPTTEQTVAVFALTQALCDALEISYDNIVGHGEIQTDRDPTEGTDPAERMRQGLFLRVKTPNISVEKAISADDDMDDQPIADMETIALSDGGNGSAATIAIAVDLGEPPGSGHEEDECGDVHDIDVADEDDASGAAAPQKAPLDLDANLSAGSPDLTYTTNARGGLNLRAGPGTEFPVIGSLPFGTRVQQRGREGRWGLVDEKGDGATDGFVHLAFLKTDTLAAARSGVMLAADEVRAFWSGRNPRSARLYDQHGNARVDPSLLHASARGVLAFEASNPNYRIEMYGPSGGFRSSGSTANHGAQPGSGRGAAMDFVIIDLRTGRMLTNHPGANHQNQGTVGGNAPLYQKFYNEVVRAGSQLYNRFDAMARFGGYFGTGSNAMDTMHIDMRGLQVGTSGGNLRGGFTSAQMTRWSIPANHPYP